MHRALAREHSAASVHQRTTQRSLIEPHRHLIGKTGEHAARDRAGRGFALLDIETFLACDGEKLLPKLTGFARGAAVASQARAPPRIEVVLFRKTKRADQDEEVGFVIAAEKIIAIVAHCLPSARRSRLRPWVSAAISAIAAHAALFLRGEQHARIAGMNRKCEHAPAERGHLSIALERAKIGEQLFARFRALSDRAARASETPPRLRLRSPSSVRTTSARSSRFTSGSSCGAPFEMFALRPEPQAVARARCGPRGPRVDRRQRG